MPPASLVAGDGPYARALASIFGTACLPVDNLKAPLNPNDDGGYDRVLAELRRVFLVISDRMSVAEALQYHEAIWEWVQKLARAGDQHDLAFLFILPVDSSKAFEEGLAMGLSVSEIDPAATGHAVWRRSGALIDLIDLAASIYPKDFVLLRNRRATDIKRAALARLRASVQKGDSCEKSAAAVLAAFAGHEYYLDLFCKPPSHRHGNLFRKWLREAVTIPVTPHHHTDAVRDIATWLL